MSTLKKLLAALKQRHKEGYRFEVQPSGSVRMIPPPNWRPFVYGSAGKGLQADDAGSVTPPDSSPASPAIAASADPLSSEDK